VKTGDAKLMGLPSHKSDQDHQAAENEMKIKKFPNRLRATLGALILIKCPRRLIYSRISILTLILSFCSVANPVLVMAPAQSGIEMHEIKFYLDPTLVQNMNTAKSILPKYVEDMNTILAKNTSRRLAFDPDADIILTTTQPFSNQAAFPLPVEGFEIWAYVTQSQVPYS
jgi:hypothetical protein